MCCRFNCTTARRFSCPKSSPKNTAIFFKSVPSQVSPVWCDFDGEHVIFNSAKGRQKDKNVRRDPRVAMAVIDPDNPYRHMEIRGRVVEITEDGASAHIDKMAKKYLGADKYPYSQPGEVRVLYKIKPEHATVMG